MLYGVLMAGCYITLQQWKVSLSSQRARQSKPQPQPQQGKQQQQQQQQQQYPFGSAFLTIVSVGEEQEAGRTKHQQQNQNPRKRLSPANVVVVVPKTNNNNNNNNNNNKIKSLPFLETSKTLPSVFQKIGKNGMLLNNPWLSRQPLQLQRAPGGGYAPTGGGGVLPTSPTFSTHYHENMWPDIDNGTCRTTDDRMDDDYSDADDSNPVYKWQLRAPYVILLGTMKGGTQALTSYLWQHPRFA
jgi:hypothetical protein